MLIAFLIIGTSMLGRAAAQCGATGTELAELHSFVPQPADWEGISVAIAGNRAVVGAGGADEGRAYIFEESGGVWTQVAMLRASDGAPLDQFGNFVAINAAGDLVAVGAMAASVGAARGAGAAYLFSPSGPAWTQVAKLTAADPWTGDGFGKVSIHGRTLVVGAAGNSRRAKLG